MDEPRTRPPTPTATKIGFVLMALTFIWWFAYYANWHGPFGLFWLKLACINGATDECVFFQKNIRTSVPTYYPVLWYAALVALTVGAYQSWQARKAK